VYPVNLRSLFVALFILTQQLLAQSTASPNLPFPLKKVAFVAGERVVVIEKSNTATKPKQIVSGDYPAWSPDGTRLAFCVREGRGFGQVQIVDADGSERRQLTNIQGGSCDPDWSPDGLSIAVTVYSGKQPQIGIVSSDAKTVKKLTDGYGAKWSPDGKKLVFCRWPTGQEKEDSIWVINADGSNEVKLVQDASPVLQTAWMPNGTGITFTSKQKGNKKSAIYKVGLDGANVEKIVGDDKFDYYSPRFSPDGKQLIVDAGSSGDLSVTLLDLATKQRTIIGHGIHPSIVWQH